MARLDKLKKIVSSDYGSVQEVTQWEAEVKKAILKDNLLKHDGIKLILEEYQTQLNSIDEQLLENRGLTDDDRKLLFIRKDWCKQFISLFTISRSIIKQKNKVVDDELRGLKNYDENA